MCYVFNQYIYCYYYFFIMYLNVLINIIIFSTKRITPPQNGPCADLLLSFILQQVQIPILSYYLSL